MSSFLKAIWLLSAGVLIAGERQKFSFEREAMGTRFAVVLYGEDGGAAEKAAERAFAKCDEVNLVASDYLKDSELSKIGLRDSGEWIEVSAMFFDLLDHSKSMAEKTEGAFDPTMGALTKMWRISRETGELAGRAELEGALASSGWQHYRLDAERKSVMKNRAGLMFDLGGVAKGYAADLMLETLVESGFPQSMVVAGGDVRVGDAPPERDGWGVAVRTFDRERKEDVLILSNAAVSTSGDLYQWIEIDGVRYSHILDPSTGLGLKTRIAATVIAEEGKISDPLATAACVLGEKGVEKLRHIEGVRDVRIFFFDERGDPVDSHKGSLEK